MMQLLSFWVVLMKTYYSTVSCLISECEISIFVVFQQDSRPMLDLLWRYYEKNKDYGAAAKILNQLAHVTG